MSLWKEHLHKSGTSAFAPTAQGMGPQITWLWQPMGFADTGLYQTKKQFLNRLRSKLHGYTSQLSAEGEGTNTCLSPGVSPFSPEGFDCILSQLLSDQHASRSQLLSSPWGHRWILAHPQPRGATKNKGNHKDLREPGTQTRLIDESHLLHKTSVKTEKGGCFG